MSRYWKFFLKWILQTDKVILHILDYFSNNTWWAIQWSNCAGSASFSGESCWRCKPSK